MQFKALGFEKMKTSTQMRCHEHLSKAKNVWFWASKIELDLGFHALFQIRKIQ